MPGLSDVYESARINIPLKLFRKRADLKPWEELDEKVRSELADLEQKIRSVVRADELCLAKHRRVIDEFNRGVRDGYLAPVGDEPVTLTRGPYDWGHAIGTAARRRRGLDPETVGEFVTATHLLAYEFGQLDEARTGALEFILRNVGPQRAEELGELAFALPVLINYRRDLAQSILDDDSFSLADYHATQSPAPTHLEYLTHGIVALFDPSPESWVRVAANMALAAKPFTDGTTLKGEHFQAPEHAAEVVSRAPIGAREAVRRQVDRVLMARDWVFPDAYGIQMAGDRPIPVTLWNVYQSTPASRVRGGDAYFGDLVAGSIIYLVSRYFESVVPPEQTGFQFLRQYFSAFTRGFDSRVEGVVDPQALASAARGRSMSEGLRRFENGGSYIGHVSAGLQELALAIKDLHRALEDPVAYVMEQLEQVQESVLATHLLELFRKHPGLPRDLFREKADFELFSKTHVKTASTYDLIRSVLYHVMLAVRPDLKSEDEASLLRARARESLDRILDDDAGRAATRLAAHGVTGPGAAGQDGRTSTEGGLLVAAELFDDDFEQLVHLMRRLVQRLHKARVLGKPQSTFRAAGATGSPHRNLSGAA